MSRHEPQPWGPGDGAAAAPGWLVAQAELGAAFPARQELEGAQREHWPPVSAAAPARCRGCPKRPPGLQVCSDSNTHPSCRTRARASSGHRPQKALGSCTAHKAIPSLLTHVFWLRRRVVCRLFAHGHSQSCDANIVQTGSSNAGMFAEVQQIGQNVKSYLFLSTETLAHFSS